MTNTWESNNVHQKPLLLAVGAFLLNSQKGNDVWINVLNY